MKIILSLTFICLVMLRAEIVVIANPGLGIDSLNNADITHLFLGKNPRFPDGSRAVPVEYSKSSNKAYFYQHVIGKTLSQLKAYWASLMFTGKGRPPKQFSSIQEVLEYVSSNTKAVSYIREDEISGHVKILYRLR